MSHGQGLYLWLQWVIAASCKNVSTPTYNLKCTYKYNKEKRCGPHTYTHTHTQPTGPCHESKSWVIREN